MCRRICFANKDYIMRKLIFFFTLCLTLQGANFPGTWQSIGIPFTNGNSTTTLTLNATASWIAFSYIPYKNHTLAAVAVKASALTGSVACTDLELDIYSDNGAAATKPLASLGAGYTSSTGAPIGGSCSTNYSGTPFIRFSGYTGALTAGTVYWAVVKNNNGTPASNFPTILYGAGNTINPSSSNSNGEQNYNLTQTTANSGTSWTNQVNSIPFIRWEFSDDSSYAGTPYESIGQDSTNLIFGVAGGASGRELGTEFVSPPVQLNVIGVTLLLFRSSLTPAGNFKAGLWTCTGSTCTNIAYTTGSAGSQVTSASASNVQMFFTSTQHVPANSTLIVSVGDTSADDATHTYRLVAATVNSDTNSLALLPFGGATTKGVYCTGTCTTFSNWSAVTNTIYGFSLILDPAGEFTAPPNSSPIAK